MRRFVRHIIRRYILSVRATNVQRMSWESPCLKKGFTDSYVVAHIPPKLITNVILELRKLSRPFIVWRGGLPQLAKTIHCATTKGKAKRRAIYILTPQMTVACLLVQLIQREKPNGTAMQAPSIMTMIMQRKGSSAGPGVQKVLMPAKQTRPKGKQQRTKLSST